MPQTLDATVKVDSETMDFKSLPGLLSIANYDNGNTIVSESRDLMSQEVQALIAASKDVLLSVPYHNSVVENGEEILKKLNPDFAKQKEQEEKINSLEHKIGGIEHKLDNLCDILNKKFN